MHPVVKCYGVAMCLPILAAKAGCEDLYLNVRALEWVGVYVYVCVRACVRARLLRRWRHFYIRVIYVKKSVNFIHLCDDMQ